MNIKDMNTDEIKEYALQFNIFKAYDFPEYLQIKQQIIDRLNELGIAIEDVDVTKHRISHSNDTNSIINII